MQALRLWSRVAAHATLQPARIADRGIALTCLLALPYVHPVQGSRVCCKVYGSASGGLRFKAAPATPGSWGRVFTKRRGNITDNRPPGGLACAPSKGAATQAWSHTNSSCVASAGKGSSWQPRTCGLAGSGLTWRQPAPGTRTHQS